jgi:signal transduction histidine kinase/Fe-S-cluster-containing hydrogenase component 2
MHVGDQPLVSTIKEKCRMCYTCVRECPAKAIQVSGGQAQVLSERCIGCGNCILVCAMKAKLVYDSTAKVRELLSGGKPVAAIIAPSYPAEFADLPAERLVGALRRLGFASVHEVSFGADLVAREYARLLAATDDRYIATTCPAVVAYVEKYAPELAPVLCPVVSPMIATARVVRALRGGAVSVVFVGPCVAKKGEAESPEFRGEIEAVLTFRELRGMFESAGIEPAQSEGVQFDPPRGGAGGLFPVSRGLLQASGLTEDLMRGDLVVADEQGGMWRTIRDFQRDPGEVRLLEVLSCHGCVMGPGFTQEETVFTRQRRVTRNLQRQLASVDPRVHARDLKRWRKVALGRSFQAADQRLAQPSEDEMKGILLRMGKQGPQDELNCGACGYLTCRDHSVAVFRRLAEPEMCLPFTIEQLRTTVSKLEQSHEDLSAAREALTQSERLASMGQIAAGIAHEVNNPLGVVLIYANLLLERIQGRDDFRSDLSAIVEHADRCKKIVAGLLNFARQNKVFRQSINVMDLVEKSVTAARLRPAVRVRTRLETGQPVIEVDPDQMIQVLSNLFANADAAMPEGGCLTVRILGSDDDVTFEVSDTGVGIAPQNLRKVFEPFFTTKQVGKGTGLGLAVVHGIIKMHGGRIAVRSNADPAAGPTGTIFQVTVPRGEDSGETTAPERGEEAGRMP